MKQKLINVDFTQDRKRLKILDQTKLPLEIVYEELETKEEIFSAIKLLKVRGAPAIGIAGAMGLAVLSQNIKGDDFVNQLKELAAYLNSSRPTAVNLSWATNRLVKVAEGNTSLSASDLVELLKSEADKIRQEDIAMCKAISEHGLELVKDNDGILTHCNAGPLATSEYGTGLGTILLGKEKGLNFHCYVDETRPLLQGARITAFELERAGIDITLICDNMASIVMKQGKINAVFVGCDRVAANGDTANKIGTSGVAVLAKYYNIPFYVFCPSSTIDFNCKNGNDIVIEERSPQEIKEMFFEKPVAPTAVKCYNPAFDVTDNSLITAIITEKGICKAPFEQSFKEIIRII